MINNNEVISRIFEKVNYEIDKETKRLLDSNKVRKEMKKKYGASAFLDSKELKFPVINPTTGKLDCALIYAAVLRASIYSKKGSGKNPADYYMNIKDHAVALYKKEGCSEKIKVKLNQEEIDILIMNDIFDIVEAEEDRIINNTSYID